MKQVRHRLDAARLTHRVLKTNRSVVDSVDEAEAVLLALAQAVELRDRTTGGHCERLALFSLALGMALGLNRDDLLALYQGGYLHDIGKVGLPDSILFKPGALTEEEWAVMRRHPLIGEQICGRLRSLDPVLPVIRSHHERWDGSGYPDGLKGEEIPLLARILQLADIYDALTTVRPYKRAFSPEEALDTLQMETDRGWRDPELMRLFVLLHEGVIYELSGHVQAAGAAPDRMEISLLQLHKRLMGETPDTAPQRLSTPAECGIEYG